jgi:antitoxin VapB
MATAKIFKHGGSQAVRLPKEFRFEGTEVTIERRGNQVVLTPKRTPKRTPELKTLADVAKYLAEKYPQGRDFPDIERPRAQQKRDLDW